MIQMQRSNSLPGPAHPPNSRSPSDSHSSQNAVPRAIKHSLSNSRHTLKSDATQTDPEPLISPIMTEIVMPKQTPNTPIPIEEVPKSPTIPRRIYKPLLDEDVSQYTSIYIKDTATEANSTTLEELAHLVRLSKYQVRKRTQTRIRLQRYLVSTALSARLARCGELALRTLVDSFRSDDKKTFSTLYNAIHDVSSSVDAAKRYAVLEPDLDLQQKNSRLDDSSSYWTFVHEIPPAARETLFQFLTNVRTNPEYLAHRICSLSPSELSALTVFHQGLEPVDSVLPFHNRPRAGQNRSSSHAPSPVERLLSFQRHDPLSTLIHTCFANSATPDSAEHIRRTEIWATVCARLIGPENKVAIDPFLCSVLNIWTAMREWTGRTSLEWYLMKTLEEGAFLVEKSESMIGGRHGEPRTAKESIAAEEFFDSAVKGLFEFVDDPEGEGIPESVLELGNAILRKLDPKRHPAIKRFIVSKWLFLDFLLNAIVHPESHGMMTEYHISEYARQRILKEVALRAGRLVIDLTWKQTGAPPPPEIRNHIENIMGRFKTSKSGRQNPKLLPARSITSLRETTEVRPYLVISPSDLVTMVNALFPERRPTSGSTMSESQFGGFRSTPSSVSGFSMASRPGSVAPPSRAFETASTVSEYEPSIFSDATTSHEPLLMGGNTMRGHTFSSTSISSMSQGPKPMDDEGYRLRHAIREMSHALGSDIVSGSCHPCAEQWAVLFMDSEGKSLSTQMLHDEDDAEDEEQTSSSDSDNDQGGEKPDLDKDYHQLRDAIVKLVGEFEIPRSSDEDKEQNTFSNRANALNSARKTRSLRRKASTRALASTPQTQSRNPYKMYVTAPISEESSRPKTPEGKRSVLLEMLEAAEKQCQGQSDFVNSHLYWRTSQQLHSLSSDSLRQNDFVSLLNICSRGPRDSIRRSASAIEEYDAWLVWLKQSQERHDGTIEHMIKRYRSLRDKMWYVTDVRNSAAYDAARHVVLALRAMAISKNSKRPLTTTSRGRNLNRPSANSYFGKTETQFLDLMAAADEHGGPNKLADSQADMTAKWIKQSGIEIKFCQGEERILRFCMEVDNCINKLIGDSVMDGPVLWASELFARDKRFLDSGRQKGDLALNSFGGLSLYDDAGSEHSHSSHRSHRSADMVPTARNSNRDLRGMSLRNGSQASMESSRWGSSRLSLSGDTIDSPDYFGHASPVLSIDTTATFYSPFSHPNPHRVTSPAPSVRSFRPGTSSTTNDTIMEAVAASDSDVPSKVIFLEELKRTLYALLISDLGGLVFSRGSETDGWFGTEMGQEFMERKLRRYEREQREQRRERRKSRRNGQEEKRSLRDLRIGAGKSTLSTGEAVPLEKTPSRSSQPSNGSSTPTKSHSRTGSFTTVDSATSASTRQNITQSNGKGVPGDFPYKKAFRRLLTMFAVHPNPYAKLNALYELHQLVVASLTSTPRRRPKVDLKPSPSSAFPVTAEAIQKSDSPPSRSQPPSPKSPLVTPDQILDTLQSLFRSADMRPKTLFRDLQYIAAFVPAHILDHSAPGKAYWDCGLAALGLKQDVVGIMVEVADDVVRRETEHRGSKPNSISGSVDTASNEPRGERAPPGGGEDGRDAGKEVEDTSLYALQDAQKMWQIAAREGFPVAARELAISYLTHPDLEKCLQPLSRPREIFKGVSENGFGRSSRDDKTDPATLALAVHWMDVARRGGDKVAEEWGRMRGDE